MRRQTGGSAKRPWLPGLTLGVMMAACSGGGEKPVATEPGETAALATTPANRKLDPATAGHLRGKVALDRPAPANQAITMSSDPVCLQESKAPQLQELYVVGDDGKTLANVFVYVKDGLGGYVFDTPREPVRLEQQGCRYHPHVLGVRVGQPVEIVNNDPTLHNVHAIARLNREFNLGQPSKGTTTTRTFTRNEVMIPIKCDVHGWMKAYVGVLDHPYFAVTGKDGTFDIASLPPGTYTVEAWHEKLGTQDKKVTLAARDTQDLSFTFNAAASSSATN